MDKDDRSRVRLPGLTDTADATAQDAFQAVADQFNVDLATFVSSKLTDLLESGELPADKSGAGPTIMAVLAAMLNSAGRLCASFEPHINGEVVASIVADQFNAGRADQMMRDGATFQ